MVHLKTPEFPVCGHQTGFESVRPGSPPDDQTASGVTKLAQPSGVRTITIPKHEPGTQCITRRGQIFRKRGLLDVTITQVHYCDILDHRGFKSSYNSQCLIIIKK